VPEKIVHGSAARRNWEAALALEGTGPAQVWRTTACFYSAVQAVEAFLAETDMHGLTHGHRLAVLASNRPPAVRTAYMRLKHLSEDWRYRASEPSDSDYARARRYLDDLLESLIS
jgi:hypothetical protein